jgi:polar amino acid transport system substrate-binding protein
VHLLEHPMEEVLVRKLSQAAVSRAAMAAALALACAMSSAEDARPVNPFEGKAEIVPEGNSLFNQYCAHCHGPNAQQGERPRDLRRLKIRYGDDAIAVFYKTVSTGRMEKGMPVWKGVLSDEVLWKIFTFLASIQSEP